MPKFQPEPPYATAPSLLSVNYSVQNWYILSSPHQLSTATCPTPDFALDLNLDPGNLGLIYRFGSSDYEAKSH